MPRYDLELAALVAESCLQCSGVHEVYLFGSVAHYGKSDKDIDLLLVVDGDTADGFITRVLAHSNVMYSPGKAIDLIRYREYVAISLLGLFLSGEDRRKIQVDLFLMPVDWKRRVQNGWVPFKGDPEFLSTVANSARKNNPKTSSIGEPGV